MSIANRDLFQALKTQASLAQAFGTMPGSEDEPHPLKPGDYIEAWHNGRLYHRGTVVKTVAGTDLFWLTDHTGQPAPAGHGIHGNRDQRRAGSGTRNAGTGAHSVSHGHTNFCISALPLTDRRRSPRQLLVPAHRIMLQLTAGSSAVSRPPSSFTLTFSDGRTDVESSAVACQ